MKHENKWLEKEVRKLKNKFDEIYRRAPLTLTPAAQLPRSERGIESVA
jgi:hypothetical protein